MSETTEFWSDQDLAEVVRREVRFLAISRAGMSGAFGSPVGAPTPGLALPPFRGLWSVRASLGRGQGWVLRFHRAQSRVHSRLDAATLVVPIGTGRRCPVTPEIGSGSVVGPLRSTSMATKVAQVEDTRDNDADDEQCLWNFHEPPPIAGELDNKENQDPQRKGHAQSEPLHLRQPSHSPVPVLSSASCRELSPATVALLAHALLAERTHRGQASMSAGRSASGDDSLVRR